MAGWPLHAVMLPEGDAADDRWLTSNGWSDHPTPEAEDLPGGFALPGLVDAHSHVSFGMGNHGPIPFDRAGAEEHRVQWASDGVALLRDAGGAPGVVLSLPSVPGRPHVVAAGRHLAPAGMYFEAVHRPLEADRLVETALSELSSGATWVKLVADFTPVSRRAIRQTAPEPTYDLGVVRELVIAVHAAGRRIAAHVTTALVGGLVRLGIDSVEHGTSLDEPTVAEMAQRGTAWTPTLCAVLASPPDATDERRRSVAERRARMKDLLPRAIRLGIPVLTGSDLVGVDPARSRAPGRVRSQSGRRLAGSDDNGAEFPGARLSSGASRCRHISRGSPPGSHGSWKPAAIDISGVRVR